jgi:hypothetical protein
MSDVHILRLAFLLPPWYDLLNKPGFRFPVQPGQESKILFVKN